MGWQNVLHRAGLPAAPRRLHDDLNELIAREGPRSLLVVTPDPPATLPAACAPGTQRVVVLPAVDFHWEGGRFDLAVLVPVLDAAARQRSGSLIASLRDIHAAGLYVVVPYVHGARSQQAVWAREELTSLGLDLCRRYAVLDGGVALGIFGFRLSRYKITPDWLNSRYWANPELFDKYRW